MTYRLEEPRSVELCCGCGEAEAKTFSESTPSVPLCDACWFEDYERTCLPLPPREEAYREELERHIRGWVAARDVGLQSTGLDQDETIRELSTFLSGRGYI